MRRALLLAAGLWLACCSVKQDRGPSLPAPEQSGKLVVAIRNGPTSFYVDAESEYAGIEYELLTRFAEQMRLKVEFVMVADADEARRKLKDGSVHLAALGLPLAQDSPGAPSSRYGLVEPVLAVNADRRPPRSAEDLVDKLVYVQAGTAYADRADALARRHPRLKFEYVRGRDVEELLEYVSLGQADAVLTGSLELQLARQVYPNLASAFDIGPAIPLTWQLRPDVSERLAAQLRLYFQQIAADGSLARLHERYYGHIGRLERPDIEGFLLRRVKLLPRYRQLFQQAEERTGIDWRLLAAVAYQESHWDAYAVSPADARGLMMLTGAVADHLKVADRHDAADSIRAGADYLQQMRDQLSRDIGEPDRTWIALAAYNIGLGHVLDARELAKRAGRNPDDWLVLREMLPLLREPRYYRTVKRGYARGTEPVRYTESVRTYYDILVRFEDQYIPLFPASDSRILIDNPDGLRLERDGSFSSDGRRSMLKRPPAEVGAQTEVAAGGLELRLN